MPFYVTLAKYTDAGMKQINEAHERREEVRKFIEEKGGRLISLYGLLGEWDVMAITEFPDNKTAMGTFMISNRAKTKTSSNAIVPITPPPPYRPMRAVPLQGWR